jgi:uncharacterized protein YdbL (DUF1318 family)
MRRLGPLVLLIVVSVFMVTCARITVNVYFPAAEIRNAAEDIEQRVRESEETPLNPPPGDPIAPSAPSTPPTKPPMSSLRRSFWALHVTLDIPSAIAQNININITTPAIRSLVQSRQQRYSSLVPLFAAGALGENSRGLLEVRPAPELALQDKARANTLSAQENRDRQQLYAELAKANNIPADKVTDIARIFAEVNRQKARAGWWIQTQDGAWKKK